MFEFAATLLESTNKLWWAHFVVPPHVVAALSEPGKARRVVCTLNDGAVEYQCALMPVGDDTYVITVNAAIRKKLGLKMGSTLHAALRKDDSEYGLPMPEELAELMRQDAEAHRLLHALTPGKLRTLLHIINQQKSEDKRLAFALAIVEHLKKMGGKIEYKILQMDLKISRLVG